MTGQPVAPRVARGPAIEWTEEDLERLAEIHVEEDTALMLAFARQWGGRRLVDILTAGREEGDGDAADG